MHVNLRIDKQIKPMPIQVNHINHGETTAGQGIRTVLYLQGCPLRCLYCHNPENQSVRGGYMLKIQDLMSEIAPYRKYFDISGGGITFSGGEPLHQANRLLPFVDELLSQNYRINIDTSGCMPLSNAVQHILLSSDEVLLDIKYGEPRGYKQLTEGRLVRTIDTAKFLEAFAIPYRIRYVVVPGLTDTVEALKSLARVVKILSAPIELLPYHTLAVCKYEELMMPYHLTYVAANRTHLEKTKEILCQNLTNKIYHNM